MIEDVLKNRDREFRESVFEDWFIWSLKYGDCDPSIWLINYLYDRMEFNIEQKFWFAWLYGNTYNVPCTWVLWNEFPDFENCDVERIRIWQNKNYSNIKYQTDTKWNKGHLDEMFLSYKKIIGNRTQKEFFDDLLKFDSVKNYHTLYDFIIKNFFKFGRYIAWFYLQTLRSNCGLNIEPDSLLFSDRGSESHRNGMFFAVGKDDYPEKKYSDIKKEKFSYLESRSKKILKRVKKFYPTVSFFEMETVLCSFKKLFREHSFRWKGYYLARQLDDIQKFENLNWQGIDWNLLHQAREEVLHKELITMNLKFMKNNELFLNGGMISDPVIRKKNYLIDKKIYF